MCSDGWGSDFFAACADLPRCIRIEWAVAEEVGPARSPVHQSNRIPGSPSFLPLCLSK